MFIAGRVLLAIAILPGEYYFVDSEELVEPNDRKPKVASDLLAVREHKGYRLHLLDSLNRDEARFSLATNSDAAALAALQLIAFKRSSR